MNPRIALVTASLLLSVLLGLALGRGSGAPAGPGAPDARRPLTIGLSLDTLQEARWQADRDLFVKRAGELGAQVIVLSPPTATTRCRSATSRSCSRSGIDVLVIVPHDGKAMAKAVRLAHDAGVPVIAYDRLIRDSDLDLYVSFDNVRIGELQARYARRSPADARPGPHRPDLRRADRQQRAAAQARPGRVLAPYLQRGDIQVVHEDWAEDWKPENAKRILNAAITARGARFDAVLASNDGTAGGAVQALIEEGLGRARWWSPGRTPSWSRCSASRAGTQAMTIYKPLSTLARGAAELAVEMARRQVVVARQVVEQRRDRRALGAVRRGHRRRATTCVGTVVADGFRTYDGGLPRHPGRGAAAAPVSGPRPARTIVAAGARGTRPGQALRRRGRAGRRQLRTAAGRDPRALRRERRRQVHADQDALRRAPARQLRRRDPGGRPAGRVPLDARRRAGGHRGHPPGAGAGATR